MDSTYLELLGFVKNPKLFNSDDPNSGYDNKQQPPTNSGGSVENGGKTVTKRLRIPPLITAFNRLGDKEKAMIESKLKYFPTDLIIIYDLDLSSSEQLKVCYLNVKFKFVMSPTKICGFCL